MLSFFRTLAGVCSRIFALREHFNPRLWQDESEARGLKLLREWLSPDQLAQFDASGYFDVIGCDTGKKYRIHYGSSMNIEELDKFGQARVCYCLVTDAPLAPGDVVLAQKIALETTEHTALAIANKFTPKRRPVSVNLWMGS